MNSTKQVKALTKSVIKWREKTKHLSLTDPSKKVKGELSIYFDKGYKRINQRNGSLFTVFIYKVKGSKKLLELYKDIQGEYYREDERGNPLFFSPGRMLFPSLTTLSYVENKRSYNNTIDKAFKVNIDDII